MGVEVVHDHAQSLPGVFSDDLVHEGDEVDGLAGFVYPSGGFSCFNLDGGRQGPRAVPDVFVAPPPWLSTAQRKHRLGPVERLDAGFLIHARYQRVVGWIHIQADDFGQFLFKTQIGTEVECSQPMGGEGRVRLTRCARRILRVSVSRRVF